MQTDTASPIDRGDSRFDGIALKDVDDKVLLGKLVAAINRTEWSPGITGSVAVYPPAHTRPHPTMAGIAFPRTRLDDRSVGNGTQQ